MTISVLLILLLYDCFCVFKFISQMILSVTSVERCLRFQKISNYVVFFQKQDHVMGLRDDKLVESPKLLEGTKDPLRASASHCVWATFCSAWSARAQFVPLQHWWPLVGDCVLHGRFRVSETRTLQCGSCSTDQQHHHCLPRAVRTHPALCACTCCRRGRLTVEGVCHVLSQAAPAWDLHHAPYQSEEEKMIFHHLIFFAIWLSCWTWRILLVGILLNIATQS